MSPSRPIPSLPTACIAATLCAVLAAVPAAPAAASASTDHPGLVRVTLTDAVSLDRILEGGFDVVHVTRGRFVTLLEWPGDDARIAALGAPVEVLDPAPGHTAAARARSELAARPAAPGKLVRSASGPDGLYRLQSLPPFGSGSMAGYWTLEEIKMKLDDLVASDVHGVVADKLDTLGTTWAGRPIWGLRLGKASGPVAFFSALTHAREGMSMETLFYFVDDLLSRYGSDPFATSLLDHRKIYIVPLVNPDGYAVNESTYVASGGDTLGLWRKNVRDNDSSGAFEMANDGVDINRNYGFRWGKDNIGSSPDPGNETYRGPAPFSEPETQAQRDIVTALAPASGMSFHTYGDLMIHPWGHTDSLTVDWDAFREWDDQLTRENAYQSGPSPYVLYPTNGDFTDWCYGDTLTKPRAFTWTPEIGDEQDFFWAPPSRMLPLAQENLGACYVAAAIAGAYVQADGVTIDGGTLNASYGGLVRVRARNLGLEATGSGLTGTLVPLDPGVQMLVSSVPYPALGSRQSADPVAPFQLVVDDTVTAGRVVRFEVRFTTPGGLYSRDTVRVAIGTPTLVAWDDASSGLGKWSTIYWGIVSNDPGHPSRYFTDSPGGDYTIFTGPITLASALDLSAGVHAYALYECRWEILTDYDAMTVEASLDGTNWTKLWADGTTPGSGNAYGNQTAGQPYYSGTRWYWKPEMADLSALTGPAANAVHFRFRLQPYPYGGGYDGFSFDSLRIVVYDPAAQPPLVSVGDAPRLAPLALAPPAPNPARRAARFEFTLPRAGAATLQLFDISGRHIRTLSEGTLEAGRHVARWDLRDGGGRPVAPGVYLARLDAADGRRIRRIVVLD